MTATARELLEQADALMRKNRGRGDADFPILTDAIDEPVAAIAEAAIPILTQRIQPAEAPAADVMDMPPPAQQATRAAVAMLEGDPSDWLVMDTIDPSSHSVTGKAPDTLAVVPPVTLKTESVRPPDEVIETPTRFTLKAAGSEPTPPPTGSTMSSSTALLEQARVLPALPVQPLSDALAPPPHEAPPPEPQPLAGARLDSEERWAALAEQISLQVLQRLDLFTDTGLKDQLARHLQPIVDRAGAELVSAINEQVGKLVRSYIAEAIEREIAQWRREHG